MYNVEKYLLEILVQYHQVTLPGIGTFSNHFESAQVDYVDGSFSPPAMEVQFDGRALGSDELLLHYLQKAEECTPDQAQALLDKYLLEARERLDSGARLYLLGIGRLQRDERGHIHFEPDSEGYIPGQNLGLPVIRFFPLRKTEEQGWVPPAPVVSTEPLQTSAYNRPTPTPSKPRNPARIIVPLGILAALIILGVWWMRRPAADEEVLVEDSSEIRLNVKPEDEAALPPVTDTGDETRLSADSVAALEPKGDVYTEAPEPATPATPAPQGAPAPINEAPAPSPVESTPKKRSRSGASGLSRSDIPSGQCLILVGAFRDASNARRMVRKVSAQGFTPFSKQKGDFTVVGLLSPCEQSDSALEIARTKLDTAAYLHQQ